MTTDLGNPQDLDSTQDTPGQEPKGETNTPTVEDLQKALEVANKRNSDKDSYISELRSSATKVSTLEQELERLRGTVDSSKDSYSSEEVDAMYQIKQKESELASTKMDSQRKSNREAVNTKYTNFDDLKPEISALLREQGLDEAAVQQFENDPYQYSSESLNLYAETANYRLQNKKLQAQNNTVLDNITQSASQAPLTNSQGVGGTPPTQEISLSAAEKLSPEAIELELKRLGY